MSGRRRKKKVKYSHLLMSKRGGKRGCGDWGIRSRDKNQTLNGKYGGGGLGKQNVCILITEGEMVRIRWQTVNVRRRKGRKGG